ncbi:unnamed protein product [Echinostoma caproni]|uniref:Secreted protein n=1 Tax=Echinostoma caproni TaxID=27848 RepID=A0A183AYK2_9TREM|nr:unnamed protein product [Echinostoma caproni]
MCNLDSVLILTAAVRVEIDICACSLILTSEENVSLSVVFLLSPLFIRTGQQVTYILSCTETRTGFYLLIDPSSQHPPFPQIMSSNEIWANFLMLCFVQKLFSLSPPQYNSVVFSTKEQYPVNTSRLNSVTLDADHPSVNFVPWSPLKCTSVRRSFHPVYILDRRKPALTDCGPVHGFPSAITKFPRLPISFPSIQSIGWWKAYICILLLLMSHVPAASLSTSQSHRLPIALAPVNLTADPTPLKDANSYYADMVIIDITQYEYHNAKQYLRDIRQFKPPSPELPCRYRFREDVETSALLADYVIIGWPRQAFRRRYGPLYNISLLVTHVLKQLHQPSRAIFPIRVGHLLRVGQFSVLPDPGRCWLNVQPGRAYMFFIRQPDWSGFCQISQLPIEYSDEAYERVISVLTHGGELFVCRGNLRNVCIFAVFDE